MIHHKDNNKMALVCAFVSAAGLLIMLASNSIDKAPHIEIAEVTGGMAGEKAILCGTVRSISDNGKDTVFIRLAEGNSTISAVFFKDVKERAAEVKANSEVCLEGNIQVYKGKTELVARKILSR